MAWTIRFLEDVALADLAFEATGESLEEVVRGATKALLESMANPTTVPGGWVRVIEHGGMRISRRSDSIGCRKWSIGRTQPGWSFQRRRSP